MKAIKNYGNDWKVIVSMFAQTKSKQQIVDRVNHLKCLELDEPKEEKEITWTKSEFQRFIEGVRKEGKQWIKVQKYVKTQNVNEVRKAAKKFMNDIADDPQSQLAAEFSHLFFEKDDGDGGSDEEMDSD